VLATLQFESFTQLLNSGFKYPLSVNLRKLYIVWSLCLAFLFGEVKAQSACFTMENLGGQPISAGCIPDMIIQFLDCSNVPFRSIDNGDAYNSHLWRFGYRGDPTSNVQSPVFGYFQSDTFTITLTVTADGSNYTTATNSVIVYESPFVDMSVTPATGCNPLTVCFTDLSTSPSSSIVSRIWDFGDGAISPQQSPCHTYNILPQQNCFSPTLRVENALGCVAARTFQNMICVDRPPVANFNSNLRTLCTPPYTVNFSFTGFLEQGNNATYQWNFGDGTSGTGANPSHTYTNDSTFDVTLTITDTDCNLSSTITKDAWINTREINANFVVTETVLCAGGSTQFINTSDGTDSANFTYLWNFGFPGGFSNQKDPNFPFPGPPPGSPPITYTVSITVSDPAGCTDVETKTALITVNPAPNANFTANDTSSCQAPFTVTFTAQTTCATCTFTWDFGVQPIVTSTARNPTFTYDTTGSFSVSFEVTDNIYGCTGTRVKSGYINIAPRNFRFAMDRNKGCAPLQVRFIDVSTIIFNDPITGFVWDFDDPASGANNTSNLSNPVHVFNDTGKYAVEMCVVTQSGCTGCFTDTVYVGVKLTPSFTINPSPACVNEIVNFINTTNDSILPPGETVRYYWELPGGEFVRDPPPRFYEEPDTLTIKLAAGIYGCFDTIEKQLIINFPKAEFYFEQDCANPGVVEFTDTSEKADTWLWRFGDGDTLADVQNPTHTYDSSGTYNVTLVVSNDSTGCIDSFSLSVTISILDLDFDVDKTVACFGEPVTFTNRSTGLGTVPTWNFGDGTTGTGQTATHTYTTPGLKTIKMVVTDALGCRDSVVLVNHINITGVTADFSASPLIGCIPPTGTGNTVTFTSNSTPQGSPITRYYWTFGDGSPVDSTSGAIVSHTYTTPGTYTVTLRVRTASGCEDTEVKANYINMRQPNANFTTAGTVFCRDQVVTTTNTTQGGGTFTWNFGCNTCSDVIGINPSYVYTDTGTFTITMNVVDANGCVDDAPPVTVRVTIPEIGFGVDSDTSYCPPHVACFDNLSTLDTVAIDRVLWDFGDGSFSVLNDPCHIYTRAGFFTVRLTVWFMNLCVDSLTESTFIKIGGATGNLMTVPDTGCAPMPVILNANSQGAASIFWVFPWSQEENRIGGDTVHSIVDDPGVWQPFIVLTDTQTPQPCSYVLYTDTLVVADSAIANFIVSSDSVCRADLIQFTDASSTVVGDSIVGWFWVFGDGGFSNLKNPTHAFMSTGNVTICLTAISKIGCTATFCDAIYVLDKPTACFTVSDNSGCDVLLVAFTNCSTPGNDAPIPGNGYYWDLDDPTTNSDILTTQLPLPYQYNDTGRYDPILVVTDLNGCDDTATVPINVYKTPDGILLGDVVQICERDTIQLFTDSITYAGYQWSPPQGLSSTTAQHPFAFPSDTITYTVDITEGHGCDMTDTIRVNVVPLPLLTLNPYPTTAICLGDSVQLSASGGLSYSWTPPIFFITASNISNPIANPPVSLTYTVTNTGLAGCRKSDTVRVIVNNLNASFAGERSCLGDSTNYIDFSTRSDLPIVNWDWDFDGDGSSTLKNPAHTYSDSGSYNVQLVVMDARGCTDTATGTTIIDFPPAAAAGTNSVICLGDSIQLFATGGTTFLWTPAPYILNPTTSSPIVFPINTTTYIANVTNGVCPYDTAEVEIIVMPLPVVQTIDDTYIVRGETIQLVTTADRSISIVWTPSDSLSCSTCLSPDARPYIKTTYRVTVIDQYGCESYDEVTIDADVECKEEQVFVANAFTPNGDGLNDELPLRLRGIEKVNFYRIYDRWGKLVFETKDMQEGWNGKNSDGQNLSSGVYVYVVDAVCFYGKSILKTGNVTLIK